MTLEEIKAWLEANKDNADVAGWMQSLTAVTLDKAKAFLDGTDEGKAYLTSEKDKHFAKGLETWKANNVKGLVEAEVKKLYPDESPEMLKIKQLEQQLAEAGTVAQKEKLMNAALKFATDRGIPAKHLERFLDEDEEKTIALLTDYATDFESTVDAKVKSKFKEDGYTPAKGDPKGGKDTPGSLAEMAAANNVRNK